MAPPPAAGSSSGGLSCCYHRPAQVLLVSLREFRQPWAFNRGFVRISRASSAVLERCELRAASSPEAPLPPLLAGAEPQEVGQAGASVLPQLTPQQRDQLTQDVVQAFLAAEAAGLSQQQQGLRSSGGGSGSGAGGSQQTSRLRQRQRRKKQQRQQGPERQHDVRQESDPNGTAAPMPKTAAGAARGASGAGSRSSRAAERSGKPAALQPHQRGLQGQVVEHLMAGGFDEALLEAVPTHTLNWAIKVLGEQQQQVVLAEQLFHWMRVKGKANQHSFAKLCEACSAARQPWRALHAWRTTRRMPQASHILGSHAGAALILTYRSTRDHSAALAALEDVQQQRGMKADRYAFNAAMRVCADAGAADDALRLLCRLRQLAQHAAAGQRPQQQQQQGRTQRALQKHGGSGGSTGGSRNGSGNAGATHSSSSSTPPPADCNGSSGNGNGNGSSSRPGSNLSSSMPSTQGSKHELEVELPALRTDCRSYSAALAAVAAAGKWGRTAQLQRWMEEDGVQPDAPLCTQLLHCYAEAGQAAAAQRLFDAMVAGCASEAPNRSHWNALLSAYAGAKDAAGCTAAYRRMIGRGLRPDAYTLVAVLRAAFQAQVGLAAVQAVRADMARYNVQLNRQLATAMLCCLRHVRPGPAAAQAAAQLQLLAGPAGPASQVQQGPGSGGKNQGQQRRRQPALARDASAVQVESSSLPVPAEPVPLPVQQQQEQEQGVATNAAGPAADPAQQQPPHHQQPQQPQQPQQQDQRQECLQEAHSIFQQLQKQAAQQRQRQPLDLPAYNSLSLVQLAAGDYEGVLHTFQQLEADENLLPDATTLGVVISACQAAGWKQQEQQYRQLLHSSRLLLSLPEHGGSHNQRSGTS